MCKFLGMTLVVLGACVAVGDDPGKTREIPRAKLLKVLKAKVGERIVVVEDVSPVDVESIRAKVGSPGTELEFAL